MAGKIIINADNEIPVRLDSYLAKKTEFSREYIKKLINAARVKVNKKSVKVSYQIQEGDRIEVNVPKAREAEPEAVNIPLKIIYEDDDLLVIDKKAGMVVHEGAGGKHEGETLVNAVLWHCRGKLSGIGGVKRPGIVHRLDKDTSGIVLVAKNDKAHRILSNQFKERLIRKKYLALVAGNLKSQRGKIVAPIGRDIRDRKKMGIADAIRGREAESSYETLKKLKDCTLVNVQIHSGRTHQIRVHMASIGHPVIGDQVYGNQGTNKIFASKYGLKRQFLHATEIVFERPSDGKQLLIKSDLPEDLAAVLKRLEGKDI